MKKIINILQTAVVIYGLALGFTLIIGMLNYNNPYMIFIILPLPFFIAIYEYLYIKEAKHDYKHSINVYKIDNNKLSKQVSNYKILDKSRIDIIDIRDKEITKLKEDYNNFVSNTSNKNGEQEAKINDIMKEEPFSDLVPYIGMQVKVKYAGEYKLGAITKILDEKVIKYRVRGCGSAKYTREQMEVVE